MAGLKSGPPMRPGNSPRAATYWWISAVENTVKKGGNLGGRLPSRKFSDCASRFLPCNTQIVKRLQIQPEFRRSPKIMTETQSCVPSDGALSVHNLRDPIRGDIEIARELRSAHAKRLKLFG